MFLVNIVITEVFALCIRDFICQYIFFFIQILNTYFMTCCALLAILQQYDLHINKSIHCILQLFVMVFENTRYKLHVCFKAEYCSMISNISLNN